MTCTCESRKEFSSVSRYYEVTEASGQVCKRVLVLVAPGDYISANGRVYDETAVEQAVNNLRQRIRQGIQSLNFKRHPKMVANENGAVYDYKQNPPISQTVDIWRTPSREVYAILEFIDTPEGRDWSRRAARRDRLPVSWRTDSDCTGEFGTGTCYISDLDGIDWLDTDIGEQPGFSQAGLREVIEARCPCRNQLNEVLGMEKVIRGLVHSSLSRDEGLGILSKLMATEADLALYATEWDNLHQTNLPVNTEAEMDPAKEPDPKTDDEEPATDKPTEKKLKDGCEGLTEPDSGKIKDTMDINRAVQEAVEARLAELGIAGPGPKIDDETLELFKEVATDLRAKKTSENISSQVYAVMRQAVSEGKSIAGHDLSNKNLYPPKELAALTERCATRKWDTKEAAMGYIIASLENIAQKADNPASGGGVEDKDPLVRPKGEVIVEVVSNERPYKEYLDKIEESASDWRKRNNPVQQHIVESLAGANKDFAKELMERHEERQYKSLVAAANYQRTRASQDGITESTQLVTDANLLNRDLVLAAITSQRFHQMMAARLVGVPGPGSVQLGQGVQGLGRFVSLQTEVFKPATDGDPNFFLEPTDPTPEVAVETTWQQHFARYLGLGYRIADQEIVFLGKGPLHLDAVGRLTAQASAAIARQDDKRIHSEILTASDEYRPIRIEDETTASGSATHFTYSAGGGITYQGKTYGANVCGAVWLRRGAAGGATVQLGPVVRSRQILRNWDGNVVRSVLNAVTIDDIDSIPQVMGYLDDATEPQIQPLHTGETPTFAVDWDRGVIVFKVAATSGFDGTAPNMPVMTYSAVRNYTRFDLSLGSLTREEKYNELVSAIADLATEIRKLRYDYPDYALFPERVGGKTIPHAKAFEPLTRKEFAMLRTGFGPDTVIGEVSGVNLLKTETPLPGGELRAIISRLGHTVFMPIEPLRIEGPLPGAVSVTEGSQNRVRYTSERVWNLREINLLATPTVIDQDGTIYNFPSTSLYFDGTIPGYTLGIS